MILIALLTPIGSSLAIFSLLGSTAADTQEVLSQETIGRGSSQPSQLATSDTNHIHHILYKRSPVEPQGKEAASSSSSSPSSSHRYSGSYLFPLPEESDGEFEVVPLQSEGEKEEQKWTPLPQESKIHPAQSHAAPTITQEASSTDTRGFFGRVRSAMSMKGVDFTTTSTSPVMSFLGGKGGRVMKQPGSYQQSGSSNKNNQNWGKFEEAQSCLTQQDINRWLEDSSVAEYDGKSGGLASHHKKTISISGRNLEGRESRSPHLLERSSGRNKQVIDTTNSRNIDAVNDDDSSISSHYSETEQIPAEMLSHLEDQHLSSFGDSDLLRGSSSEGRSTFRIPRLSEKDQPNTVRLERMRAARVNGLRKATEGGRNSGGGASSSSQRARTTGGRENRYDAFQRHPSSLVQQTQWENEQAARIKNGVVNLGKYLAKAFTTASDTQQMHRQQQQQQNDQQHTFRDPFHNEEQIVSKQQKALNDAKMKKEEQESTRRHTKRSSSQILLTPNVFARIETTSLNHPWSPLGTAGDEEIIDGGVAVHFDDDRAYDDVSPQPSCHAFDTLHCMGDALARMAESCCPRREENELRKEHSDLDLFQPSTTSRPSLDHAPPPLLRQEKYPLLNLSSSKARSAEATPSRSRFSHIYQVVKRAPLPVHADHLEVEVKKEEEEEEEKEEEEEDVPLQRRSFFRGAIAHEAMQVAAYRNGKSRQMEALLDLQNRKSGGVYDLHRAALISKTLPRAPRHSLSEPSPHGPPPPGTGHHRMSGEGAAPDGGKAEGQDGRPRQTFEEEAREHDSRFSHWTHGEVDLPDIPSHRLREIPDHERAYYSAETRLRQLKEESISKGLMKNPETFDPDDPNAKLHGRTREESEELVKELERDRLSRQSGKGKGKGDDGPSTSGAGGI